MTEKLDQTETLIEQALARRAEQAPPDAFLLTRVHSRLRRRRTGRRAGAALIAATAVAAGIAGVNILTANDAGKPSDPAQLAGAPDGWRWESYRTVELQVPETWGYGTTGSPPCLVDKLRRPYVGRPGPIPLIGCPDQPVKLAFRSSYVWLGDSAKAPVRQRDHGWVEETRTVGGVSVTVFSDDAAVRSQILDSIRQVDGTDVNGCAVSEPSVQPGHRPAATGGLDSVGKVGSVTVCKYADLSQWELFGSSTIDGPAAGTLVDAIRAAPQGSGPNTPHTCTDAFESEVVVLKVRGDERQQDVVMRYHGCKRNGTDDGTTVRQLTREVVGPVLTGMHYPSSYSGSLGRLLPPR